MRSRWLKRIGLGKRGALAPAEPPNRYERKRPGELVHVDDERGKITVERVLSDNGACYRSRLHAEACAELQMRHLFIQTLTNRWAYGPPSDCSART